MLQMTYIRLVAQEQPWFDPTGFGNLYAIENETHALGSSAGTFGAQRIRILAQVAETPCMTRD
jgi:HPt (histidine-containing phosphotransfer) domain-containing protein